MSRIVTAIEIHAPIERGFDKRPTDLNAGGGVLGQAARLIKVDDYCEGEQAVAAANKLVAEGVAINSEDFRLIAGKASDGTVFTSTLDLRDFPQAPELVARLRSEHYEPIGPTFFGLRRDPSPGAGG
jgi:hypothetical protein